MSYLYSKSGDFGGNLNIAQLQNETVFGIPTPILLGITISQDDVEFVFTTALTPVQKNTLDTVVANHVPSITGGTGTSTGALLLFYDLQNPISPFLTNFQEIYKTTWQNDFSKFTIPKILFESEIFISGMEIQISSSGTPLGSYISTSSEISDFTFSVPTSGSLEINIRRLSRIGKKPILKQLRITFIN